MAIDRQCLLPAVHVGSSVLTQTCTADSRCQWVACRRWCHSDLWSATVDAKVLLLLLLVLLTTAVVKSARAK